MERLLVFLCLFLLAVSCQSGSRTGRTTLTQSETVPVTHGDHEAMTGLSSGANITGVLVFKNGTKEIALKFSHGYLVKGPSGMDPGTQVMHMILTTTDMSKQIQNAARVGDLGADFMEGVMIEIGNNSKHFYWMVLEEQRIQYSGHVDHGQMGFTAFSDTEIAGHLNHDARDAGGAKLDVQYDLHVMREFRQ